METGDKKKRKLQDALKTAYESYTCANEAMKLAIESILEDDFYHEDHQSTMSFIYDLKDGVG